MSTVELRLGDMFDGPSDLIVLPCSTSGTITPFVRRRLVHHRIPYPRSGMELGDVQVLPFDGGENIAQFVGFAASVDDDNSSESAIRRIGEQLGQQTAKVDSIRRVAVPLLGAGAGGLKPELVTSTLSEGFRSSSHKDAGLLISILHPAVFERVRDALFRPGSGSKINERGHTEKAPRVFVSYSHTSPEHEEWVTGLGSFLRQNGVDARIDVWHLRRGMDLPQFMTNELTLADRVLLISDERYAEKADGRVGGVGWETMIVQGDIARLPPDSTKYLVIVRSQNVDSGLPRYLQTKFVIHWPDKALDGKNQKVLLRELFDSIPIPPLGQRPLSL
jgi:hypothetical protein